MWWWLTIGKHLISVRPVWNYLFPLSHIKDDKSYSHFSIVLSDSTCHIISLGFVFRKIGTSFTLLNYWYKWGWFSTLWNFPGIQTFNKFNTSRPDILASSFLTLYSSYWHQQWYQLFFYEQARKFFDRMKLLYISLSKQGIGTVVEHFLRHYLHFSSLQFHNGHPISRISFVPNVI